MPSFPYVGLTALEPEKPAIRLQIWYHGFGLRADGVGASPTCPVRPSMVCWVSKGDSACRPF